MRELRVLAQIEIRMELFRVLCLADSPAVIQYDVNTPEDLTLHVLSGVFSVLQAITWTVGSISVRPRSFSSRSFPIYYP